MHVMRASDFKVGARQLLANRGYTAVLVSGLAIALAISWVLWAYLLVSTQTDSDIPDAKRIYRLENRVEVPGAPQGWVERSPMAFKDAWKASGAPVEAATRFYPVEMSVKVGNEIFPKIITFVDPEFAGIFSLETLQGDLKSTLQRPDAIALSHSASEQLFGTANALGRVVLLGGSPYTVGATMRSRPKESALYADVLVSTRSSAVPEKWRLETWFGLDGQNFVKLFPNARTQDLLARAKEQLEQSPWFQGLPPGFVQPGRTLWTPRAVALDRLRIDGAGGDQTRRLLATLTVATVLIALLAGLNFVNLAVVRVTSRHSEIGVRKALGAAPAHIAALFITESAIVGAISFAAALPLGIIFGYWFERVTQVDVASLMLGWWPIATLFTVGICLGIVAGLYPALVAYRLRSSSVISGRGSSETGGSLKARRTFTALQFCSATVMLGCAAIIYLQAEFASKMDPGFNFDGMLAIEAPVGYRDPRLAAFRNAVADSFAVSHVSLSADIPGRGMRFTPIRVKDEKGNSMSLAYVAASPDFFDTYGIVARAGRVFNSSRDMQGAKDIVVVSSLAARQLGYANDHEAVGRSVAVGRDGVLAQIVGVVHDIRLRSLREDIRPTIYVISSNSVPSVTVRARDIKAASGHIANVWPRFFPDDHLRIERISDQFARNYSQDRKLAGLIAAAALIALVLSACGSFALAAYTVERKTREIAIRRLHGASGTQIARLIWKDLVMLVVLSAAIGTPLVLWIGNEFLKEFGAKAPYWMWTPALATIVLVTTVLLAAAIHVRRALKLRPIEALRA